MLPNGEVIVTVCTSTIMVIADAVVGRKLACTLLYPNMFKTPRKYLSQNFIKDVSPPI